MTKTFTRPGRAGHFFYQLYRYALVAMLLCAGAAARAQYAYHSQFGSQGTGNGQFSTPVSVAVDYDGFIYVSDQNNHRVQRFRADGTYNMTIGGLGTQDGKFNRPAGIAVDQLGFLYVADQSNGRIQRFTPTGLWNLTINSTDASGVVRLGVIMDVDVDKDGNIYALNENGTVVKYNVNGEWVKTFTFRYAIGYRYTCLAVDADGNLYISEARFSGVSKYNNQGTLLWTLSSLALDYGQLDYITDITLDKMGNLLLLEHINAQRSNALYDMYVLKFDANRNFLAGFGATGTGNGQFQTPRGIALDPNDNVLVADMGNYRVQRFTALPEAEVKAAATVIADNTGSYDFGSATVGTSAVARTFTISNATGARPLTVSNLTLPAGFGLTGNFPATIAAGGTADFTVALSPAALGTFSGTLSFNTNDPNENPYNFTISGTVKQPQTITFDSIPEQLFDAQTFTLAATASSGLPVTYALVSGRASVTGANVNWWSAGLVTVRASQAGDAQYSAAAPVERTFRVRRTQAITFVLPVLVEGQALRLHANVNSLLPVTYSVVAGPATIQGDTIRLTGAGEVTVKASQAGNEEYLAAPDNIQQACSHPAVPVVTADGITLKSSSPTGNQWFWNGGAIAGATGPSCLATLPGQYEVSVTGSCGQPVRSTPFVVTVSAAEPALFRSLRLYPNPVAARVTLSLAAGVKWQSAAILDGQGRLVMAQSGSTGPVTFATGHLPKGFYLLEVRVNTGVVRRKFLVQ